MDNCMYNNKAVQCQPFSFWWCLEKLVDLRVDFSMTTIVLSMVIISVSKQIIQLKLLTAFKQSTTIN